MLPHTQKVINRAFCNDFNLPIRSDFDNVKKIVTFSPNPFYRIFRTASASVIFSHGLGDTAIGWYQVISEIALELPWISFVLPTAPTRPVTINNKIPMHAWYDIISSNNRAFEECPGLDESRQFINELIQQQVNAGIPHDRIVLGGFSQGGALSIYTGLQHKPSLAGVLVMSGYLPSRPTFQPPEFSKMTKMLICHGKNDMLVEPKWAKGSVDYLQELGFSNITWKAYEGMENAICEEELEDVKNWIKDVLPDQNPDD